MTDQIPVIDLTSFPRGDRATRVRVAKQLGSAAETLGFVVISGHGIDPAIGTLLKEAAIRFFDLPGVTKMVIRRPTNDQNRGYIPYGEETLVRMAGGDSPPDYKEVFAIGPDDVPQEVYFPGDGSYPSFAPNLWPDAPADLRPKMLAYWRQMEKLMRVVGEALAIALDLPDDAFADVLDGRHTSQLRLLHYPPPVGAVEPGQLRAGEHSDVGMMTILRNDPVPGGLQVKIREGEWVDAPAVDNTFILNIGDLLMRWTNDRFVSTLHRVMVPPLDAVGETRRLSIGFFVGPRYNATVECLPTCCGPDDPPKYAPVLVDDYRTNRFAAGAGDNSPFRAD